MKADEFYEQQAPNYDARHDNDTSAWMRKIEASIISRYSSGFVVDIGCGTFSRGDVGCDIAYAMLNSCRNGVRCAAEDLPFKNESFDTALCMFTVLNMAEFTKAVGEMSRVLKKGGHAIISVASCWDASNEPFWKRKTGTPGTKRMRIDKSRIQFHMFTRKEIEGIFMSNGFDEAHFESIFILQKPYWGWFRKFSLFQKTKLRAERLMKHSESGRIYFLVFRKR